MKVEHLEEVIKITIDEEAKWARSEFPHPLVTLDYDEDGKLIAVSAIDRKAALDRLTELSQEMGLYE